MRAFRRELGLSQEDAAQWLGWSAATYQRFEQGRRGMDVEQLAELSEAFGRPMDHFRMEAPPPRESLELPPFRLVVRPGVKLDKGLLADAESAIRDLNARYLASSSKARSKA